MNNSSRYWEIDLARAIALGLMIVQHTEIVWNLVFLGEVDSSDTARRIGKAGALLFLLLVGLSSYILYSKKNGAKNFQAVSKIFLIRGLSLLAWGVVISLVTFFIIPASPVYFGVLSFIGVSLMFLPYLIKYRLLSWFVLFTAPVIGVILSFVHPKTLALLGLGIYPVPFYSSDYWPVFPWITVVLFGVIIGRALYKNGSRQFKIVATKSLLLSVLQWVGSHTLVLYMVHLPILYVVFSLVKVLA